MPDDKKPDSRFTMIAEEMTVEIRPSVIAVEMAPRLMINDTSITCSRCGLGAFNPGRVDDAAVVYCLACPLPSPIYKLPGIIALSTSRYRCCACGNQLQVTMVLSDVNLHCGKCGGLTLHSRQDDPSSRRTRRDIATEKRLEGLNELRQGVATKDAMEVMTLNEIYDLDLIRNDLDRIRDVFPDNSEIFPSVIGSKIKDADPTLVLAVDEVRRMLGLEDFDKFSESRRNTNRINRVKNIDRRTGRTWRAIVNVLARCGLERTDVLWVKSVNSLSSQDIRKTIITFRETIKMECPKIIKNAFPDPITSIRDMIYFDHAYYDRIRP